MEEPLILYSTNTWLAYMIAQRYYEAEHYVWCTPYFDPRRFGDRDSAVPPTSSPFEVYCSLAEEVSRRDRHSKKVEENRAGILRGANAKRQAAAIDEEQEKEIASIVSGGGGRRFPAAHVRHPVRRHRRPDQGAATGGQGAPSLRGIRHRPAAPAPVRRHRIWRRPMSIEVPASLLENPDRQTVVDACYFVVRVLRNANRGYTNPTVSTEASPRAHDLANRAIGEIEAREGTPIGQLSERRASEYIGALEALIRRTYERTVGADPAAGAAILEDMRASGLTE
jgi:hypothetical protein